MRHTLVTGLALLALLAFGLPASANTLVVPADYAGKVDQTAQDAIILWSANREELVLSTSYAIDTPPDRSMPATLAWVIPVPAGTEFAELSEVSGAPAAAARGWAKAKQELFRSRLKRKRRRGQQDSPPPAQPPAPIGPAKPDGIKAELTLHRLEVQGGDALNRWLGEKGYAPVPAKALSTYAEGWSWLVVTAKLEAPEGVTTGSLPPVHVSFKSEQIVYPLKVCVEQRLPFAVTLWVATADPLDKMQGGMPRSYTSIEPEQNPVGPYGFYAEGYGSKLPSALAKIQGTAVANGFVSLPAKVHLTKVWTPQLNVPGRPQPLVSWEQEFTLLPGAPR